MTSFGRAASSSREMDMSYEIDYNNGVSVTELDAIRNGVAEIGFVETRL